MLNQCVIEKLKEIKSDGRKAKTIGLSDSVIKEFIAKDARLVQAIDDAWIAYRDWKKSEPQLAKLDEIDLIKTVQGSFLNFYDPDSVSPYVPLCAKGPWVVTAFGAVVYDTGGYGMLGLGHAPEGVSQTLAAQHVMANLMTPSLSHQRFSAKLREVIGMNRKADRNPYAAFVCLNSGSESNSVALRIADINAKLLTDQGAKHAGKRIMLLAMKGSFHGRTDRPAQASDSSMKKYALLASFRDRKNLLTVEPNNIAELEQVYAKSASEGYFIEATMLEPVMGEGNPGMALTAEFYKRARELSAEHGSLLIVDSIQAGLRCQGVLSITDYPGFESLPAPDVETFSKAINAGQYPLSVVALGADAAKLYRTGVYGNTMTSNPRALEVAITVLNQITPELQQNIRERGKEFINKLEQLKSRSNGKILKVQGTGLLVSAQLADTLKVEGVGGIEEQVRTKGVNVIHGGVNSLRFTPNFGISSDEIDLIVKVVAQTIGL